MRYVEDGAWPALAEAALTLDELERDGTRAAVEAAFAQTSLEVNEIELHRFRTRYASGIAILDPAEASIVDCVPEPDGEEDETVAAADG